MEEKEVEMEENTDKPGMNVQESHNENIMEIDQQANGTAQNSRVISTGNSSKTTDEDMDPNARTLPRGLMFALGSKRSREYMTEESLDDEEVTKQGKTRRLDRREDYLRRILIGFADRDPASIVVEDFESLADQLLQDSPVHDRMVVETLAKCASSFPLRTSFYAVLVAFVNKKARHFCKLVIEALFSCLLDNKASFSRRKLSLRVLLELAKLSILEVRDALSLMDKLCTEKNIFLVLENLPWGYRMMRADPESCRFYEERIAQVVNESTVKYNSSNNPSIFSEQNVPNRIEYIWQSYRSLFDANKKVEEIDSMLLRTTYIADEAIHKHLSSSEDENKHKLERLEEANNIMITENYLLRPCFSVFGLAKERFISRVRSKNPNAPKSSIELASEAVEKFETVDAANLTQCIEDIVVLYNPMYKEVAKALDDIMGPFPLEHLIVEVLLGLMLSLPRSELPQLYYESILVQLCRNNPKKYAVVVEDVIDSFIACIRQTDPEVVLRVAGWFSYHLFTFGLKWNWGKWDKLVESAEEGDPRKLFLDIILDKTMALTYRDDLVKALTPALVKRLPNEAAASNPFDEIVDETAESREYTNFLSFLKTKPDAEKIKAYVKEHFMETTEQNYLSIIYATLEYGKASNTHFAKALDRVVAVFDDMILNEQNQQSILRAVERFWQFSPARISFVYKCLLRTKIVQLHVIFRSCLEKLNVNTWWLYEFLDETLEHQRSSIISDENGLTSLRECVHSSLKSGTPYVNLIVRRHPEIY